MIITYIVDNSGVKAGAKKDVPEKIALAMIDNGICVAASPVEQKQTDKVTKKTK